MTKRFDARIFAMAKDADQPSTYQDAYAMDAERGIVAIADGVSSALFSGPWAAILTEAVVGDAPDPAETELFAAWIETQRRHWAASIDTSGLAWFQRAKLPAGAFSTLLWARLLPVEESAEGNFGAVRLRAWAIGDSCLFHVRGGELVRSFPLQCSSELQADPIVLGSVDLKRDHQIRFDSLREYCYPGDLLVLCTDALAEWALRGYEAGQPPDWLRYWSMPFEQWQAEVIDLQQQRQIRYDDTTLLLVQVAGHLSETAGDSPASPGAAAEETSAGWIESVSKDFKSVSSQMSEQLDHASERVVKGLKSLGGKAMERFRDVFKKRE